jgi:hypothetical protein
VLWPDFLFREDGQPSSRGLGSPPGAHPETQIPAGEIYVHIFHPDSITIYHNHVSVLNEVRPMLVLQCDPTNSARPMGTRSNGSSYPSISKPVQTLGPAAKNLLSFFSNQIVANDYGGMIPDPINRTNRLTTFQAVKLKSCILTYSWSETVDQARGTTSVGPIDVMLDFSTSLSFTGPDAQRMGTYGIESEAAGARDGTGLRFLTNAELAHLLGFFSEMARTCGGSVTVHDQ